VFLIVAGEAEEGEQRSQPAHGIPDVYPSFLRLMMQKIEELEQQIGRLQEDLLSKEVEAQTLHDCYVNELKHRATLVFLVVVWLIICSRRALCSFWLRRSDFTGQHRHRVARLLVCRTGAVSTL
jgi:hypothetical protein